MTEKPKLREAIRQQRRQVSSAERAEKSGLICQRISDLESFQSASHVAGFLAFDGEADPLQLMRLAELSGKKVFVPMIVKRAHPLRFAPWSSAGKTKANRFGILEPDVPQSLWIPASELDFVITPLVGFTAECDRLGVGGGYYDRTFSPPNTSSEDVARICRTGFALDLQRLEDFKVEPWDQPLDFVATETTLYQRTKG